MDNTCRCDHPQSAHLDGADICMEHPCDCSQYTGRVAIPAHYHTEEASTCFALCGSSGEGSYYCPDCGYNTGSVWHGHEWRPTMAQALCHECLTKYNAA
jgi:hypothetical protein